MAIRQIKVAARNLPEGHYRFKIVELSEDTDPKKGSDMFKIKFATVSLDDGKPRTAWDQFPLSDDIIWKFATFLESLGYVRMEDGTVEFDDTAFVGKQGYLECTEKEVEKDGKSRTYTNYRYLKPDDEKLSHLLTLENSEDSFITIDDNSSRPNDWNSLRARLEACRKTPAM
jgi:hypothetical protein